MHGKKLYVDWSSREKFQSNQEKIMLYFNVNIYKLWQIIWR